MRRPPRPDDLYRLRVATDPRLSPDGRAVVVTLQTVSPGYDQYRTALWLVPTASDGGAPRQLTIGARHDHHARFSPDGRTLAFLSDRRVLLEEDPTRPSDPKDREDGSQVYLLPLDGGEARRLTDLPRGVTSFEWAPDGSRLVVTSSSHEATRDEDLRQRGFKKPQPGDPPDSDYRFIDRLGYMYNGSGFIYDRVDHLWLVDVATGEATRLTEGPNRDEGPTWSPDGRRIAFVSNRRPDADLRFRPDIYVVDVRSRALTRITAGPDAIFGSPVWLPDGNTIVALGNRLKGRAGVRNDVWLFDAKGKDATATGGRNLSGQHDRMPLSAMNSDVTRGEGPRPVPTADGSAILFSAPIDGSYELWRIAVADGRLERVTTGRHYISGWDAVPGPRGRSRIAYLRSSPTETPDVWLLDGAGDPRRLSAFNADVLGELSLIEPSERHVTVDGRDIQGWLLPSGKGARPLVTEIHGGPATLYGWSLSWEFQCLAASGMSVYYSNPRGSEGYGLDFVDANHRDWGEGPTRDVLAGVDALVADGLADPDRLGVTGGSYGGYLTTWIVGHDQRFRAAMTCRSVSDMASLMLSGDISGVDWARLEFGAAPWEDPELYRQQSPLTYAPAIRTPLLIQHSERDLRTTVTQAEMLFTVLRELRRPVRLLRVPEDTHELTRSGTPFRRIENLRVVTDWFRHFLVDGKRSMPPLPKVRGGR